jgi:hypothetical protein
VRSGEATTTQSGASAEVSAVGDSAISRTCTSTRVIRSKGKGASVRNTEVFPSPSGVVTGPISEVVHPARAASPSASPNRCIVASHRRVVHQSAVSQTLETGLP